MRCNTAEEVESDSDKTGDPVVFLLYFSPFLFPFECRQQLFYCTAMDRDRALSKLQVWSLLWSSTFSRLLLLLTNIWWGTRFATLRVSSPIMAGEVSREEAHTKILTLTYSRSESVKLGLGKNTNFCDVIPHFIVDGVPIWRAVRFHWFNC